MMRNYNDFEQEERELTHMAYAAGIKKAGELSAKNLSAFAVWSKYAPDVCSLDITDVDWLNGVPTVESFKDYEFNNMVEYIMNSDAKVFLIVYTPNVKMYAVTLGEVRKS